MCRLRTHETVLSLYAGDRLATRNTEWDRNRWRNSRVPRGLPFVRVAKKLYLDWSVSEGVFSEEGHDLVQAIPRRTVLVKEISGKEDKVDLWPSGSERRALISDCVTDIMLDGELKDLLERIYGVLSTDWVPFEVADVVVGREHNLYGVVRDLIGRRN